MIFFFNAGRIAKINIGIADLYSPVPIETGKTPPSSYSRFPVGTYAFVFDFSVLCTADYSGVLSIVNAWFPDERFNGDVDVRAKARVRPAGIVVTGDTGRRSTARIAICRGAYVIARASRAAARRCAGTFASTTAMIGYFAFTWGARTAILAKPR